jgi:hypothetical protein
VNLFGRWWESIDTDIRNARVGRISSATAEGVILDYEWLGTMPAVVWDCFGIYFDGHLGGVAVYSPEYSENLGVWDRFGFTGKMILLSRGACVHWAHPHAGSKLIRHSMRLLLPRYEVVTATVDSAAGEIGTIYQACGFHYCGAVRERPTRPAVVDDAGRIWGERRLRRRFGHSRATEIAGTMPGWGVRNAATKGRYFAFRGPNAGAHLRSIERYLIPYPKRAA